MARQIEFSGPPAALHHLANLLIDEFQEHPEEFQRIKLAHRQSYDPAAHGTPEHFEKVILDYSDYTPEQFALVLPLIKTIFALTKKLISEGTNIKMIEKDVTGSVSAKYQGSS